MDNPCKHCDKAIIDKPTVLKCFHPCTRGKNFYECEKELINILSEKIKEGVNNENNDD